MVTVYKYKLPLKNGKAYLSPPELIPDKYFLSAYYPTNTKYRGSYSEYRLYLNQMAAKGEMDTNTTEYYNGEYLTPIAHFSTNENHLVDVPVQFKVDNETIGEYRTDQNGVATAPPYLIVMEEGEHKLTATIPDGPGYIGTTVTQTFTTKKTLTQINIDNIEPVTRGNIVTISGTIDSDHPFLAETTSLELKYKRNYNNGDVEPVTLTQTIHLAETNEFEFQLTILPEERPGYNYVTLSLPKNEYQNSSENSKSFIIYVLPQIDVQHNIQINNRYYTFYGQILDEFDEPYQPPHSNVLTYTSENEEEIQIPVEVDGTFEYLQQPEPYLSLQQTRYWTLLSNKYHAATSAETQIEYDTTPQIIYEAPYTIDKTHSYSLEVTIVDILEDPVENAEVKITYGHSMTNSGEVHDGITLQTGYTNEYGKVVFTDYANTLSKGKQDFTIVAKKGELEERSTFTTYIKEDLDISIQSAYTLLDNDSLRLIVTLKNTNGLIYELGEHQLQIGNDTLATNFIQLVTRENPVTSNYDFTIQQRYDFTVPLNVYDEDETITLSFEEYISEEEGYNAKDVMFPASIIQPIELQTSLDNGDVTNTPNLELTVDGNNHTLTYFVKDAHDIQETVNHGYMIINTQLVKGIGTNKTHLTITTPTTTTSMNSIIPITMTLKDSDGTPLSNEEIELYQEDTILGTYRTTSGGTVTRNVQINLNQQTITFTAKYRGTYLYDSDEKSILITVNDYTPEPQESLDPVYLEYDDIHLTSEQVEQYWHIVKEEDAVGVNIMNGGLIIQGGTTATFKEPFSEESGYSVRIEGMPAENYEVGLTSAITNGTEKIKIINDGSTTKFIHVRNNQTIQQQEITCGSVYDLEIIRDHETIYFTINTTNYYELETITQLDKCYFYASKSGSATGDMIGLFDDIFFRE